MSDRRKAEEIDYQKLDDLRGRYPDVEFGVGTDAFSISRGGISAVNIYGIFDEPTWQTIIEEQIETVRKKAEEFKS